MKRTLHVLLAVLMLTSVIGAEAKPKHKSKKKVATAQTAKVLDRKSVV